MTNKVDVYPLDESNIFLDLKVLLTRPRYFFEFFAHHERINHVVWAKVILIFLGLSALNSMVAPIEMPQQWSTDFKGIDPRIAIPLQKVINQFVVFASQLFAAFIPFFTLLYTAVITSICVLTLRLLGADPLRLSWSGIYCTMIASQWTTIFGFIPGVGTLLVAFLPIIYAIIGLAQITRLSKLRTFAGVYILPVVLMAIVGTLIITAIVTLGVAIFS
jgi:hypothetical protein